MKCWLYEILKAQCEGYPNWLRFIEHHKKDIRFESIEYGLHFFVDNVLLKIEEEKSIKRIVNIRAGAA